MSDPIALGRPLSPSPPSATRIERMQWGKDARSAPISSDKRMPVVDRSKVDPLTLRAAEGMEAMFLDYMMKVMRQTVPKNELDGESPATEIYRSMQDSEIAQRAAHSHSVGLADQVIAYLQSERYTSHEEQAAPMNSTGGAHESKSIDK